MTDVLTIPTESNGLKKIDPPRNMERLWLEVGTTSVNGCTIENHHVPGAKLREPKDGDELLPWQTHVVEPVPVVIEVYADRLTRVLERTRGKMHEAAYASAVDLAKGQVESWERENKAWLDSIDSAEARAKYVRIHCNHRPEHHLAFLGVRGGMPPLVFCKVVDPKNRKRKIDAFDFANLDDDEFFKKHKATKASFMVEAPPTPYNAAQRANENLAQQLAEALKSIASNK